MRLDGIFPSRYFPFPIKRGRMNPSRETSAISHFRQRDSPHRALKGSIDVKPFKIRLEIGVVVPKRSNGKNKISPFDANKIGNLFVNSTKTMNATRSTFEKDFSQFKKPWITNITTSRLVLKKRLAIAFTSLFLSNELSYGKGII